MTAAKQSPWFAVAVRDMDRIRQKKPERASSILAVWLVLVREAHFKRSNKVTLTAAIVADRAQLSRRTVMTVSDDLQDIGLVKKQSRRDKRTGRHTPIVWTVNSAVSFVPSASDALGPSAKVASGSPSATEEVVSLHTLLHTSVAGNSKKAAASLRPKSGERAASKEKAVQNFEQIDPDDWRALYQAYRKEDQQ